MLDPVTNLPPRTAFFEELERKLEFSREHEVRLGLVLVDVDRLKRINRLYGYQAGDRSLRHVADALGRVARPQDSLFRVGNGSFALLLSGVLNRGHAELAAHKVIRELGHPVVVGDSRIDVSVRIGISLSPDHGKEAGRLFRYAEEAVSLARRNETVLEVFPEGETEISSKNWLIDVQLESALERDELELYYQPKIDIRSRRVAGAEALVRWNNPRYGLVSPEVFIPIVERTGKMKALTTWAINRALRESGEWQQVWEGMTVSVNVPAPMVPQPDFPDIVRNTLNIWREDRAGLVLEITESTLLEDREESFRNLQVVRDLGVKISIDDFGTGYSSLSYFRDIPADELKIDKSFVDAMEGDSASRNIVEMIVDLSARFGLRTVAEGVENHAQLASLIGMKCAQVQGYLFARPLPQPAFLEWLRNYQRAFSNDRRLTRGSQRQTG